tara:strand:- start:9936 stop:11462 length:1527 start_codon:yes stop_codon:yes gene_type:complete
MINLGLLAGHNIWQSIVVLLLVAFIFKIFKKTSAEDKSWSWTVTLFMLALMPLVTFLPGEGIKTSYLTINSKIENLKPTPIMKNPQIEKQAIINHIEKETTHKKKGFLWVFYLWLSGVGVSLILLCCAAYNASRLRHAATSFKSNGYNAPKGWPQNVDLGVSDVIGGPIVVGVFKPMVLVPRKFMLDIEPRVLNPLLFHELAHVKRNDNAFYVMERGILCLYWWNPVMHFTAHKISIEREKACDDRAALLCGDPLLYAKSLLSGAKQWINKNENILAMSIFEKESTLSIRIKRLIANETLLPNLKTSLKNISMLLAAIITVGLLTPRLSVAKEDASKSVAYKLLKAEINKPLTKKEEVAIRAEIKQEIAANKLDIKALQKQVREELNNAPEVDIEAILLDVKKVMAEMVGIDVDVIRAEITKEFFIDNPYLGKEEILENIEKIIASLPPLYKDEMYKAVMASVEKEAVIDKDEIYKEVMKSLSKMPPLDSAKIATKVIKNINKKRAKF